MSVNRLQVAEANPNLRGLRLDTGFSLLRAVGGDEYERLAVDLRPLLGPDDTLYRGSPGDQNTVQQELQGRIRLIGTQDIHKMSENNPTAAEVALHLPLQGTLISARTTVPTLNGAITDIPIEGVRADSYYADTEHYITGIPTGEDLLFLRRERTQVLGVMGLRSTVQWMPRIPFAYLRTKNMDHVDEVVATIEDRHPKVTLWRAGYMYKRKR
ncbi:MAG TPA: hypothetical protein VLH38_06030 [Patescibacteria group bacterium]|nr:hypothetical protein [Patescibacteria group bacterium]